MARLEEELASGELVQRIKRATSDEEALAAELSELEETENDLQPGDPKDQPAQMLEGSSAANASLTVSNPAQNVINIAAREVGTKEAQGNKTKYGRWYGLDGNPWCAMFLSWCFYQAGIPQTASTSKGFAYTPSGAAWYQRLGRWGATPKVGAVVFFKFPPSTRINHVGLVVAVNGKVIDTIEGNTSDGVFRRRRSSGIVGYGYPTYVAQPSPRPDAPAKERIKELQRLLGVAADGDFGPKTGAACDANLIGFQQAVNAKNRSRPVMKNPPELVKFLKRQMNRRFNYGLDAKSTAVGPQVDHGIVVGLGQSDSICGKNGYFNAVR
jgi:hypothetical protein